MGNIPAGYSPRPRPNSLGQARKLFSNDKIKNLTKLKVQQYIESFFKKLSNTSVNPYQSQYGIGDNNSLLQIISPKFLNYNIDKSFDPQLDPTQKKMQIARYFNELRGIVPCILVLDGGVEPVPQTIGLISDSMMVHGSWSGRYPITRKINLSILAAARDQDEADEMSGVISLMFNELRNIAGGSYISGNAEQGETWVIALPNQGVSVSSLDQLDIEGDPIEKIFYSNADIEVFFEDVIGVQQELPAIQSPWPAGDNLGSSINFGQGIAAADQPQIIISDTVSINAQPTVFIRNFRDTFRLVLSDSSIATLSYTMALTPRKLGKVKLQVVDVTISDRSKCIVAEKEIRIVP